MSHSDNLLEKSRALFRKGQLTDAIKSLEVLLAQDENHVDALEALGVYYAKDNRLDEAIKTMKRLSQASPNHIMAHTNLSVYYMQKGMILEAEQEQAEARRLSWKAELKASPDTPQQTPEEIRREQAKDLEDRIARYQKVIQLDPKDVLGYFSLGQAYLDGQKLNEAKEALQKAIQVDPMHSPSFFSLGLALETLKETNEAIKIYQLGIQVADQKGDMIPLNKMTARLKQLKGRST